MGIVTGAFDDEDLSVDATSDVRRFGPWVGKVGITRPHDDECGVLLIGVNAFLVVWATALRGGGLSRSH